MLAGQTPAGVDPALAELVLPLDQLVDNQREVFGGYKAGIDLLRCGICGEENTLLPFADEALAGFSRTVFVGTAAGWGGPAAVRVGGRNDVHLA